VHFDVRGHFQKRVGLMVLQYILIVTDFQLVADFQEYFQGLWGDRNTANFDEQRL
jgi:hypothetical protein